MPKSPNATMARNFRFTEDTLAKIDRLVGHHKVLSRAEAIRIAVDEAIARLPPEEPGRRGRRTV